MKNKIILLFTVFMLAGNTLANAGRNRPWLKWTLLTLDLGLSGLAAWAVIDQRKAADEYNTLYAELDNTTEENYRVLQLKEEDVETKGIIAVASCVAAGAFVGYTIADKFWIHEVFPTTAKMEYDTERAMLTFSINHNW